MASTCLASSRVGASTITRGARPFSGRAAWLPSSSRCTMGSTNASVLPHPVLHGQARAVGIEHAPQAGAWRAVSMRRL